MSIHMPIRTQALFGFNSANPQFGWAKYIDAESWADRLILYAMVISAIRTYAITIYLSREKYIDAESWADRLIRCATAMLAMIAYAMTIQLGWKKYIDEESWADRLILFAMPIPAIYRSAGRSTSSTNLGPTAPFHANEHAHAWTLACTSA